MSTIRRKSKKEEVSIRRKHEDSNSLEDPLWMKRQSWENTFTFIGIWILFILIAFWGLTPAGPALQQDQTARIRIVADVPFFYESTLETNRKRMAVRDRVPPVYRLDQTPFQIFKTYLKSLDEALTEFADIPADANRERYALRPEEVQRFLTDYPDANPYNLRSSDLAVLINQLPKTQRNNVINEGLLILENLYREGIYGQEQSEFDNSPTSLRVFNVQTEDGQIRRISLISEEDALRNLRINLAALDISREASIALFRILRSGLNPNILFDESKTAELAEKSLDQVEPIRIYVREGETLIEPDSKVTALQLEQLEAYREALTYSNKSQFGIDGLLIERALITLVTLLAAILYLRLTGIHIRQYKKTIFLTALTIALNLLINRLVLEMADSQVATNNPTLITLLPFLLPFALAPMLVTILLGSASGVLCAGILAVLNALMQGNDIVVLIASFASALTGIFYLRKIQVRSRVVRAGIYSGLIMSIAALALGIRDLNAITTVIYQIISAISIGTLTGIVIIGMLPFWESLFKTTTDITLLELTDFNHPLLRKMQVEAPGSYHHSLMVANLSENAAAAIGANPLLCRVCALFHDIGKMIKPEYFTENQRDGKNPHIEQNPSMSALVIKSHVKEGVVMARKNKMPKIIIDVISQHHGTSLIQYFYYKALERQRLAQAEAESPFGSGPRIELDQVNAGTYRYEGPIPQFTESGIIMLADSIEAAGRSLRKVTPQAIDELIDDIVTARVEDGQLDNCPLTFRELAQIKESFSFTLLNMLHARVEYPKEATQSTKKASKKKSARRDSHSPFGQLGEKLSQQNQSEAAPESDVSEELPSSEESKDTNAPNN